MVKRSAHLANHALEPVIGIGVQRDLCVERSVLGLRRELVASDAEHLAEVLDDGAPLFVAVRLTVAQMPGELAPDFLGAERCPVERLERLGRRRKLVLVRVRQEAVER